MGLLRGRGGRVWDPLTACGVSRGMTGVGCYLKNDSVCGGKVVGKIKIRTGEKFA